MRILEMKKMDLGLVMDLIQKSRSVDADVLDKVIPITLDVKEYGDVALKKLTAKFDKCELDSFLVSRAEVAQAWRVVPTGVIEALKKAKKNVEIFHKSVIAEKSRPVSTAKGVKVWRVFRPIEKVGLYIPGGTAAYPSTVLMLAVPAKIAGCNQVVLCTPAGADGKCNPAVTVAADLCGVKNIYKVGGAQAIAAMVYGTESIPKVDKIFGPGNQYVATAKTYLQAFGKVAIDMPAGPSEVMVIADDSANPNWVAADLLSQLEHGIDSQAVLVCFSKEFAKKVITAMKKQTSVLPRRDIIKKSFGASFAVVISSNEQALAVANNYAPEHLEIVLNEQAAEEQILNGVNNAGSVFLGKYSSEPLGDYATGSNHTLPTSGYAKMYSPLSTESFGKYMQVQKVSQKGIGAIGSVVEILANAEGLQAHAKAVTIRFEK